MFGKSLLSIALVFLGTSSIKSELVLDITTANHVMDVIQSSHTIDSATRLILEQAPLQSSLPDDWSLLKTEQESLKTTARTWRSDGRSALFRLNDGIIAFMEQFVAFYDYLEETSDHLDDEGNRSDFVAIIEELNSEVFVRKEEATNTANQLKAFSHSVITHHRSLDRAYTSLESQYIGQNGVVQKLVRRIATIDEELERINEPVSVTMSPSEQLTHARESAANFSRLLNEKQKLYRQRVELQFAVNETRNLLSNVRSLAVSVNQVVDAADQMVTAWNQLEDNYKDYVEIIQSSSENVEDVKNTLSDANTQWLELSQRASVIKINQLTNQARG